MKIDSLSCKSTDIAKEPKTCAASEILTRLLRLPEVSGTISEIEGNPPAMGFELKCSRAPETLFNLDCLNSLEVHEITVKLQDENQLLWIIKGMLYGQ